MRDLLQFAREIHVIHMLDTFQADAVLVEKVKRSPMVAFHLKTEVPESLGRTYSPGMRLAAAEIRWRATVPGPRPASSPWAT